MQLQALYYIHLEEFVFVLRLKRDCTRFAPTVRVGCNRILEDINGGSMKKSFAVDEVFNVIKRCNCENSPL